MKKTVLALLISTIMLLSVNIVHAEQFEYKKIESSISEQSTMIFDFDMYVMKLESAELKNDDAKLYMFSSVYSNYKINTFHYGIMQFENKYGFNLTVGKEYFVTVKKNKDRLIIVNIEPK